MKHAFNLLCHAIIDIPFSHADKCVECVDLKLIQSITNHKIPHVHCTLSNLGINTYLNQKAKHAILKTFKQFFNSTPTEYLTQVQQDVHQRDHLQLE